MPRTPDELFEEVTAWPLEERLRLAARILEAGAAELQNGDALRDGSKDADRPGTKTGGSALSSQPAAAAATKPATAGAAGAAATGALASRSGAAGGTGPVSPAPAAEARRLIVVDGSNFLGTVHGFDLASDTAREELILRLQEYGHAHPAFWIVAYFDGQKTTVRRFGRLEIRFTSGNRPADFYILELLRALGAPERRHALLITADRALGEEAHRLGAKVEPPSSFHRRLPGAARKSIGERGLSAAEVADWEAYFRQPPGDSKRKS
jgi:predicted RNA-binding protein with PIN domain